MQKVPPRTPPQKPLYYMKRYSLCTNIRTGCIFTQAETGRYRRTGRGGACSSRIKPARHPRPPRKRKPGGTTAFPSGGRCPRRGRMRCPFRNVTPHPSDIPLRGSRMVPLLPQEKAYKSARHPKPIRQRKPDGAAAPVGEGLAPPVSNPHAIRRRYVYETRATKQPSPVGEGVPAGDG